MPALRLVPSPAPSGAVMVALVPAVDGVELVPAVEEDVVIAAPRGRLFGPR
jgi:hypothetical protein